MPTLESQLIRTDARICRQSYCDAGAIERFSASVDKQVLDKAQQAPRRGSSNAGSLAAARAPGMLLARAPLIEPCALAGYKLQTMKRDGRWPAAG